MARGLRVVILYLVVADVQCRFLDKEERLLHHVQQPYGDKDVRASACVSA
jgi:hypothetical protein